MATRVRLIGLAAAWALLVACGTEPLAPMRVGAVLWPGNEGLFFAAAKGWLAPRDYRMVEMSSGFETIRAFRNGTLDAAALTLDEVIRAVQDGADPVLLLAIDQSHGADGVVARAGLTSLAELRGKRVGLQVNSVSAYVLRRALESARLRSDDVQIVNVAPELHQAYLARGDVDAVSTYEPFRSQLLGAGAIELFNSTAIPGEIGDVLVVRRAYLAAHPERAAGIHRAWRLARAQADSPEAVTLATGRLNLSPHVYATMQSGLTLFEAPATDAAWQAQRRQLLADLTAIQKRLADAGLISKQFPMEPLVRWPEGLAGLIWRD